LRKICKKSEPEFYGTMTGNNPDESDTTLKANSQCRYCRYEIPADATICSNCGRNQNIYLQYFRIEWIGVMVSVVMMIVALSQLQASRADREDAKRTLERANRELEAIKVVQARTLRLKRDISLELLRIEKHTIETSLNRMAEESSSLLMDVTLPPEMGGPRDRDETTNMVHRAGVMSGKAASLRRELEQVKLKIAELEKDAGPDLETNGERMSKAQSKP